MTFVFNGIPFLLFLAGFLVVFALTPRKYRLYALLVGSLVFCFVNSWIGALIALAFTGINYLLGGLLQSARPRGRRLLLALGVFLNAGTLLVLKFVNWMPVGMSYYTFACIAYLADIYKGSLQAEYNFFRFAAFVTMFPKFLQGPITRYGELAPQLTEPQQNDFRFQEGLELFIFGLCLKVLLADKLSTMWTGSLEQYGFSEIPTPLAWLGAYSYSIQLYLDWHSYTLMAVGLGRMLGYELPRNFDSPYMAKTVGGFYRRWHMTLTRWFTDYIYIPLGGNRNGTLDTVSNILIVWLVTGLWHMNGGWNWNFLIWGLSLGLLAVLERLLWGKFLEKSHVLGHLYVLFFIPLTWVCFKIPALTDLQLYFSRMFPLFSSIPWNRFIEVFWEVLKNYWPYLLAGIFFCTPLPEKLLKRFSRSLVLSLILAVLFWWAVYSIHRNGSNPFGYLMH